MVRLDLIVYSRHERNIIRVTRAERPRKESLKVSVGKTFCILSAHFKRTMTLVLQEMKKYSILNCVY